MLTRFITSLVLSPRPPTMTDSDTRHDQRTLPPAVLSLTIPLSLRMLPLVLGLPVCIRVLREGVGLRWVHRVTEQPSLGTCPPQETPEAEDRSSMSR